MELLSNHMSSRVFCDKISASNYQQHISNTDTSCKVYPTMVELLLTHFDHHYSMVDAKDKLLYMKQRLIELATLLEEKKPEYYDKFKYNKKMSISTIQHGLQSLEHVSCLLYLADLYKIRVEVYLDKTKQKILTTEKDKPVFNLIYTEKGKWYTTDTLTTELEQYTDSEFNALSECLVLDISTKDVYVRYLNSIGNYKLPELVEMATQRNISLMNGNKKKVKKQLYDEINLYELNTIC